MLLLRNNDIKNKSIARIIAVAVLSLIVLIGIEGTIYNNSHVSAVDNNNISYTMEFIENVVGNMPDNVLDGLTSGTSSLIPSNNPIRSGFKFGGWCDQATTKDGEYDVCATGHIYQPGASYTLDATGTVNNIKLYAIWQEVCVGYTTMQSLTSSSIATLLPNEHSTATVCDARDDQTYTIAKLKDGKYWMVENLNLAGGTALSVDDTDVTSAYISSFSTSNNLTKTGDTIVLPASSTSGFGTSNYSYVYNSGNKTTNCASPGCYSYYSWDAATLGSGRSIYNTDAPHSICPKGWRLPTSGAVSNNGWKRGDFYALATAYGVNLESNPYENFTGTFYNNAGSGTVPNFLLAGSYNYGLFLNGGSDGYYWSSTSSSDTSGANYLGFNSMNVGSANNYNRYNGFSVRCLFSGQ